MKPMARCPSMSHGGMWLPMQCELHDGHGGAHEAHPYGDDNALARWPNLPPATLYLPVSNERGRLRLAVKQDVAAYPCRYCGWLMPVSADVFDENPFCASCLHERMARMPDPLDGPRIECGLPAK